MIKYIDDYLILVLSFGTSYVLIGSTGLSSFQVPRAVLFLITAALVWLVLSTAHYRFVWKGLRRRLDVAGRWLFIANTAGGQPLFYGYFDAKQTPRDRRGIVARRGEQYPHRRKAGRNVRGRANGREPIGVVADPVPKSPRTRGST